MSFGMENLRWEWIERRYWAASIASFEKTCLGSRLWWGPAGNVFPAGSFQIASGLMTRFCPWPLALVVRARFLSSIRPKVLMRSRCILEAAPVTEVGISEESLVTARDW